MQRGISERHPQFVLTICIKTWPAPPAPPGEFLCAAFAKMVFWLVFIISLQKKG